MSVPPTHRIVRAIAALALVGLLAVDCCNATGEWAWTDLSQAPHLAAVPRAAATVGALARRLRPDLVAPASSLPTTVVLALVLLTFLGFGDAPRISWWSATRPPGRAPPRRGLRDLPG